MEVVVGLLQQIWVYFAIRTNEQIIEILHYSQVNSQLPPPQKRKSKQMPVSFVFTCYLASPPGERWVGRQELCLMKILFHFSGFWQLTELCLPTHLLLRLPIIVLENLN